MSYPLKHVCVGLAVCCACSNSNDAPAPGDVDAGVSTDSVLVRVEGGRMHLSMLESPTGEATPGILYSDCEYAGESFDAISNESLPFLPNASCTLHISGVKVASEYLGPAEGTAAGLALDSDESHVDAVPIARRGSRSELGEGVFLYASDSSADIAEVEVTEAHVQVTPGTTQAFPNPPLVCQAYQPMGEYFFSNDDKRLLKVFSVRISPIEHGPSLALPAAPTFFEQVELVADDLCAALEGPDPQTGEYIAGLQPRNATVSQLLEPSDPASAPASGKLSEYAGEDEVVLRCDVVCRHCGDGDEATEAFSLAEMSPALHSRVLGPPTCDAVEDLFSATSATLNFSGTALDCPVPCSNDYDWDTCGAGAVNLQLAAETRLRLFTDATRSVYFFASDPLDRWGDASVEWGPNYVPYNSNVLPGEYARFRMTWEWGRNCGAGMVGFQELLIRCQDPLPPLTVTRLERGGCDNCTSPVHIEMTGSLSL